MSGQKQQLKIRDLRNGNWYWMHKIVYQQYSKKIGPIGLALYNAYAFYANGGKCFPTQKTIAQQLNISTRTIQKFNKILQRNRLIKIESGKAKGTANRIYLLKVTSEKDSHPREDSSDSGAKILRSNKNNNNNTKLTRKDSNPNINYLIDFLKKQALLNQLDGSIKENRRYCWLCVKKFGSASNVEKLIKIAASSDFHSQNLTSFKYLYNHGVKIANEIRKKRNKITVIK